MRVAAVVSSDELNGDEFVEAGVDVLLHGEELVGAPSLARGEEIADLHEAVMGREVAVYRVRIIGGEGILVGCDDQAGRRIEGGGQLVEGNEAIPIVGAGPAFYGNVARVSAALREFPGGMIPDVAVDIGVNEVGTWAEEA